MLAAFSAVIKISETKYRRVCAILVARPSLSTGKVAPGLQAKDVHCAASRLSLSLTIRNLTEMDARNALSGSGRATGRAIRRSSFNLFPGHCLFCRLPTNRPSDLCESCESRLPRNRNKCAVCAVPFGQPMTCSDCETAMCGQCLSSPPPFFRVIAPWVYANPVDTLIHRFKNHGRDLGGQLLVDALIREISAVPSGTAPDYIVPVPLNWRKIFRRGFNQSQEIARTISRETGIKIMDRAARRIRNTDSQQGLSRKSRRNNVRHCFSASDKVSGLRIAIVDDVMTTGSTVAEFAATLLNAGAISVEVWCLARTPLEKTDR
ncbi:MAG: double zinc ribbon domain-containing protein [bacterium]